MYYGPLPFGSLIKYIPYTITTGFTCGIAVTLFVGQIKDFLGLDMGAVPSEFIENLAPMLQISQPPIRLPSQSVPLHL